MRTQRDPAARDPGRPRCALAAAALLAPAARPRPSGAAAREPENVPRRAADRHRYATMVFARGVLRGRRLPPAGAWTAPPWC